MTQTALEFATITDLATQLRAGGLGPVELAETLLRGGHDLGPPHGVPYAAKDLYGVKGAMRGQACAQRIL